MKTLLLASCLLGTVTLMGCERESAETMVASAKSYLEKKDSKAAIIQLKNALQKSPDSPEVRFLLGQALLESGEVNSAVLEFKKARELKYPDVKLVPVLARSMNLLGQQEQVLSQFAQTQLDDAAAMADLKTSVSTAYALTGKREQAAQSLEQALLAGPDYLPAQLLNVRMLATQQGLDAALSALDAVIAKTPQSSEPWLLRGELLFRGKFDRDAAISAYQKALELNKQSADAHLGLLSILISKKDFAAAQGQLTDFEKAAPNHPQRKYFQAILAFENQDLKQARELVTQLLARAPNNPKVLELAGLIELQDKALVQAEVMLSKALQAAPEQASVRRLLTQTYVRSGQAGKALTTLQPLLNKELNDATLLALAGEVYLSNGDVNRASEYFAKAAQLNPKDARSRTALALGQFAKGNVEMAYSDLRKVAESDSGIVADMALISAHLQRGELDAAIKATDALERKQPDKPLASELRGRILLAKKNPDLARRNFEQALKLDPKYFTALVSLANLDIQEGKLDQAQARFDAVLTAEPKHAQALLALAQVKAKAGASKDDVAALYVRAIEINPNDPTPRLLLIEHRIKTNDAKAAVTLAQEAVGLIPQSTELQFALGEALFAAGDFTLATTTFKKIISQQPDLAGAHLRLADAQVAAKDLLAAQQTLKKFLTVQPNHLLAQVKSIQLDIDGGRVAEARLALKTLQKQRGGELPARKLEGDIEAKLKNWDAAAAVYRGLLEKAESTELAIRYHTALLEAKKPVDAERAAQLWIKTHPKDAAYQYYLGDVALGRNDYALAEAHYLKVNQISPSNAAAQNNIAWLLSKQKKPGALAYIEAALKLRPDQPEFLDTYSMILAEEQQVSKAIEARKRALALQPQNNDYRMSLATLYLRDGKKDLAKVELELLARQGSKFANQVEVQKLLGQL